MVLIKKVLTIRNLTLAAAPEIFLLAKFFPQYFGSGGQWTGAVLGLLVANYSLWVVVWLYLWPNVLSPLRHVPGPKELITVVHRLPFVKDRNPSELVFDLAETYPEQDLITLNRFGSLFLVPKPDLLRDILVQRCYDFGKPVKIASHVRRMLGNSLPTVEGDEHRFLRKKSMPAFHFRNIRNLYPMMWKKASLWVALLRKELALQPSPSEFAEVSHPHVGDIDISSWAGNITLDVIGVAGMGHDFGAIEKGHHDLIQAFLDFLEPSPGKLVYWVASAVLGPSLVKALPWKMNAVFSKIQSDIQDTWEPIITKKRESIAKSPEDNVDILSILIKSGEFSDTALKEQLLATVAAGQETTAASICWACYLLAKHQDLQAKLREEIRHASLDTSTDLGVTLEQLPYLNGIIQETLRLYPAVPMTMRQCFRDSQVGKYFIPQGTILVISMWLINRSRDVWGEDAEACRPERWINDDGRPNQTGGTKSNYNFLTFLHGPRSCIGAGFSKAEIRCVLAALVSSLSWTLVQGEEWIPTGTLTARPDTGVRLRFKAL